MSKIFFVTGSILGGIAVATGAFGAHGLKSIVDNEMLSAWETAVQYQMFHALALFVLSWALNQWPSQAKILGLGGRFFLAGVVLFSGSLYLLVLTGVNWLGAITPLGGIAFVAGWVCLAVVGWRV